MSKYFWAIVVVLGLVAVSCGLHSIKQIVHPRPTKPPRTFATQAPVLSVDGSNCLTVDIGRRRERPCQAIVADIKATDGAAGKLMLESLCPVDSQVTILEEKQRPHLLGVLDTAIACEACSGTGKYKPPELWTRSHPEDADKLFECWACNGTGKMILESEASRPMVGTVLAPTGQDCAIELLKTGNATCEPLACLAYQNAEREFHGQKPLVAETWWQRHKWDFELAVVGLAVCIGFWIRGKFMAVKG
jgi:hypothetical protein